MYYIRTWKSDTTGVLTDTVINPLPDGTVDSTVHKVRTFDSYMTACAAACALQVQANQRGVPYGYSVHGSSSVNPTGSGALYRTYPAR